MTNLVNYHLTSPVILVILPPIDHQSVQKWSYAKAPTP